MKIVSINPATEEVLKEFPQLSLDQAIQKGTQCKQAQESWSKTDITERAEKLASLANVFRAHLEQYATLMSLEMGKPITQARAEIEKCAYLCEFYAKEGPAFLAPQEIATENKKSYVCFDPLGVVLGIMPWNFPFWQAIRFAMPTLLAGNGVLLKHASNVSQCSTALEQALREAGFPTDIFISLLLSGPDAQKLIETSVVDAVSLTGSTHAGQQVAQIAGTQIKKCVLELGGSDPFIILAGADLDVACKTALQSRMQNTGQSCIAAKRFIIEHPILEKCTEKLVALFDTIIMGDPLDEKTTLGPIAKREFVDVLESQVKQSVTQGARVIKGGKPSARKGFFFEPTLLSGISPEMPVWKEEVFGPVMSLMVAQSAEDAVKIANDSEYGLGASIWTSDKERGEKLASAIQSGFISINGMTKSDPRLPFGGVKKSGFGRELGEFGIKEFVNVKTVVVN